MYFCIRKWLKIKWSTFFFSFGWNTTTLKSEQRPQHQILMSIRSELKILILPHRPLRLCLLPTKSETATSPTQEPSRQVWQSYRGTHGKTNIIHDENNHSLLSHRYRWYSEQSRWIWNIHELSWEKVVCEEYSPTHCTRILPPKNSHLFRWNNLWEP